MAEVRAHVGSNNMRPAAAATTAGRDRERDVSPDSVIFTLDSNFSTLFSSSASASASVDRCSFASDAAIDHDSPSSAEFFYQHFGGRGSDLNLSHPNKPVLNSDSSFFCPKVEKAEVRREEDNRVRLSHDDEFQALDSARSSFSLALKECQERRSKSETLSNKLERRRPASLDLNNSGANVVSSSPRLGMMKKTTSVSSIKSGNFPSPGTPNYPRQGGVGGVNKGWSSERVPLPTNSNRRQAGGTLLPLNNGRALPSKWEDAERWIFSPVAGDGAGRPSSCQQQQLRRPKSKSGPLGPPGVAYHSLYSPAAPMYEGFSLSSHMAGSPFSAGMMMADGLSFRGGSGAGRALPNNVEPGIARSASVHGCTDLVCHASFSSSQDEKVDEVKDGVTNVSRAVSRRDMATQMSPEGSCCSSPRRSSFSPSTPSILPIVDVHSFSSSKSEVRDVQVDERVTVTRWSKKYKGRITGKGSESVDEWKLKAVEPCSSAWEMADTVKTISKSRREESKITAWENLQKAKAEAAIRKLEMKLEKKRSSSMEKIMKKLRSAQKKAQEMRTAVLTNQALQVSKTNNYAVSLRRTRQVGSLSGCFTCHAF